MAKREILRDHNFRTIGFLDTEPDGHQRLYSADFRILGYYDPRQDQTRDGNFRFVGEGNLLLMLLR